MIFKCCLLYTSIKKCETVFDKIKNKNIEKIPVLQKSGIYKLKCKDCNKVYLGETGRKFVCRSVSYTHLDVYKRQVKNSKGIKQWIDSGQSTRSNFRHTFANDLL